MCDSLNLNPCGGGGRAFPCLAHRGPSRCARVVLHRARVVLHRAQVVLHRAQAPEHDVRATLHRAQAPEHDVNGGVFGAREPVGRWFSFSNADKISTCAPRHRS